MKLCHFKNNDLKKVHRKIYINKIKVLQPNVNPAINLRMPIIDENQRQFFLL